MNSEIYYFFRQLSMLIKALALLSLALIFYGYLCRWTGIYFFWESLWLGYIFLLFTAFFLLDKLYWIRKKQKGQSTPAALGMGLIAFIIILLAIFYFVIPTTDALAAAEKYLRQDNRLKKEIGNIIAIGSASIGAIGSQSSNEGSSGNANLNLLVKGTKKYKRIQVLVNKDLASPAWQVWAVR